MQGRDRKEKFLFHNIDENLTAHPEKSIPQISKKIRSTKISLKMPSDSAHAVQTAFTKIVSFFNEFKTELLLLSSECNVKTFEIQRIYFAI